MLSDILLAVDCGDVAALILSDLSAAFDTVDYEILLQRLQTTYGISDVAHRWFRSCLAGRNTYELGPRARLSSTSSAVFLKDQSLVRWGVRLYSNQPTLVRFCSYCTLPAWFPWSKAMVWHHTYMPMTHRSMTHVLPLTSMHSPPSSLPAPLP